VQSRRFTSLFRALTQEQKERRKKKGVRRLHERASPGEGRKRLILPPHCLIQVRGKEKGASHLYRALPGKKKKKGRRALFKKKKKKKKREEHSGLERKKEDQPHASSPAEEKKRGDVVLVAGLRKKREAPGRYVLEEGKKKKKRGRFPGRRLRACRERGKRKGVGPS